MRHHDTNHHYCALLTALLAACGGTTATSNGTDEGSGGSTGAAASTTGDDSTTGSTSVEPPTSSEPPTSTSLDATSATGTDGTTTDGTTTAVTATDGTTTDGTTTDGTTTTGEDTGSSGTTAAPPEDADMDGVDADKDCDDADPDVFPGNDEVCDGKDNDCVGGVDVDAIDPEKFYTDSDKDGFGDDAKSVLACAAPPGTVEVGGDCNDNDAKAYPGEDKVCALGNSCRAIFLSGKAAGDGPYLIDPDGVDAGQAPLQLWCDMVNEGLTGALVINSVNVQTYIGKFGSGYVSTNLLATDPAAASGLMATAKQAWVDLNLFDYKELRVAAYASGVSTYTSEWIAKTDLRIKFGENGYLLYNDKSGYYWCGGDKSYTDAGVGQVNQPMGAPADCKGHSSLGSGWDFGLANTTNKGLTMCGGDASIWMYPKFGVGPMINYPNPGVAYVIWAR